MVHRSYPNRYTTTQFINSWLPENQGQSVVLTPSGVPFDAWRLYSLDDSSCPEKPVSIVICTLDRPKSLNETLNSLTKQIFKDFEVIIITKRGDLSTCRDMGLRSANGDIVCFIDDDVYCPPVWLQSVVKSFREGVVGVTGPTTITQEFRKNRDCFRYEKLRRIQEWFFNVPSKPSTLSPCGAPSMASNFEGCIYEGEVEYLECCNMSVKRKEAIDAGGFDNIYYSTSEWCELDLAKKLGNKGTLYFSPSARLFHKPSKAGIYKARLQTRHRWDNFTTFQKRWVNPSLKTYIYRGFVWTYLKMKGMQMI